jgi:hypothetical protein
VDTLNDVIERMLQLVDKTDSDILLNEESIITLLNNADYLIGIKEAVNRVPESNI